MNAFLERNARAKRPYVAVKAKLLLLAKLRIAKKRDDNHVHHAADAHLRQMTLAVNYAFMVARKAVNKKALRRATTEKAALAAMDAAPGAVKAALLDVLHPVLVRCYVAGANAAAKRLPSMKAAQFRVATPFNIRFDVSNPDAIAWAQEHAGELVADVSDTTRQDIADAVSAALDGDGIVSAYDDILAAVGDESRADMIARTEVMAAANEGQQAAWDGAVDAGLLTGNEQVEWIATSDACDDCDALDGETRPIDGEYDDSDAADGPPLHPNCRCTEGISTGGQP